MPSTPRSIPEYLDALRAALRGADPALVQDALYDAEEYLRAELAAQPGRDEAEVLAEVASSYGAPDEVATIYTDREQQVALAMQPPPRRPAVGFDGIEPAIAEPAWYQRFFGVALDPHTYGAVFYLLLALPLGIFYFTWVMLGVSLSLGLAILVIGIPFTIAFIATVYLLSLVEGRLVEALLGVRMPRRPARPPSAPTLLQRIGEIFAEPRTWSTLFYLVLKLPLGILYFTLTTLLLTFSTGLVLGAVAALLQALGVPYTGGVHLHLPLWMAPFAAVLGVFLFFGSLHLLRGLGRMHGAIAKTMLVPANR